MDTLYGQLEFQSTLPRGERLRASGWTYSKPDISIHAPTRGATIAKAVTRVKSGIFQSTLPRGERRIVDRQWLCADRFQSTLPRGERLASLMASSIVSADFNPRSHAGSDSP